VTDDRKGFGVAINASHFDGQDGPGAQLFPF
jgi:hypothetical protein